MSIILRAQQPAASIPEAKSPIGKMGLMAIWVFGVMTGLLGYHFGLKNELLATQNANSGASVQSVVAIKTPPTQAMMGVKAAQLAQVVVLPSTEPREIAALKPEDGLKPIPKATRTAQIGVQEPHSSEHIVASEALIASESALPDRDIAELTGQESTGEPEPMSEPEVSPALQALFAEVVNEVKLAQPEPYEPEAQMITEQEIIRLSQELKNVEQQRALSFGSEANYSARPLSALTEQEKAPLPSFDFQAHIYSSSVDGRWVKVNGKELNQGDFIAPEFKIVTIGATEIVLDYQGLRFSVDPTFKWQNPNTL